LIPVNLLDRPPQDSGNQRPADPRRRDGGAVLRLGPERGPWGLECGSVLQWPSPSGKNVPARFEGVLKIWNDERGFGFIEPDRGDQEIFVHIKAFAPRSGRPQISQRVSFEVELGTEGKKRAKNVELVQTARSRMASRQPGPEKWGTATLVAIPAFLLLFLAVSIFWKPPLVVALVYVGASLVTLLAYAMDKAAAERGAWRTPESTLHALALAGGWPGALLAQQFLRHKSSKAEFRSVFWVTVVLNVGAFVALCSPVVRTLWAAP
jgi:uncharacterized membrane protein YsdA (DUF1294 family)/cold shock CspA family protein